jgi:ribonuclease-3
LVKGETLAEIAREFDLGDDLILGEGELKSGGFRRESILADAVEAIIGAIFLDTGMNVCQEFIRRIFETRLKNQSVDEFIKDPKTRLQELLQGRRLPLPVYDIVNVKGESHQQEFIIRCETVLLEKAPIASASNRRQAEKLAAQKALDLIESLPAKGI